MTIGKFQVLSRSVRVSGIVVDVSDTDFDLRLDAAFWRLSLAFPTYPVLHCETYGFDDLPSGMGHLPLGFAVGRHVAVSGALVLDTAVHEGERGDHPEHVVGRGLFRAYRPKPELHPYQPGSITFDQPPLTEPVRVSYYEEVYASEWIWNRLFGKGNDAVGSLVSNVLDLGRAP